MKQSWQLQEAKNKLSEVVERAIHEGPQAITRRGEEVAVVLSRADYQKLTKPKTSLVDFFSTSPLKDAELDLARDKRHAPERVKL